MEVFMYKSLIAATAAVGLAALSAAPAEAGHGSAVGAGLAGFGIGAILGSALTPREVYVVPPPPPPPVYYGPVGYAPWTPAWYDYCAHYPGFDPRTGYYVGPGGRAYFCR
jgi:hypothetical protein